MEEPISDNIKGAKDLSHYDVNPVAWIFTIILVSTAMLLVYIERAYYHFL